MNIKSAISAAVFGLGTLVAAPTAAQERIIFNCFFPPQHYACTQWAPELKNRIETATEGRVKVNTPPKSLAAPPDQYDGVVGGVMDGAFQFNAFIANQVPGVQFSLLPFAGTLESEATNPALWTTYQKFFAEKNEYGDAVILAYVSTNGAEIYSMTDDPIDSIDDIANRKMWGLPGVVANTLKEAGSPVVAGPAVQMLEIISKGVVDGYAGVPLSSLVSFKLLDYTKSATLLEGKLFQPTFSVMVSRAKWEKISPEDQEAIMAVMGADFGAWAGGIQDEINEAGRAKIEAAGIQMIDGAPELEAELRRLGQPMIDAWIAQVAEMGVDGQEVLDFYAAEIARNRATLGQ